MQDENQALSNPASSSNPKKPEIDGATRSAETARVLVRRAKRAAKRKFPAEEKVRIVLEGVRGELPVKDFMEAGKARMRGDALREASSDEVALLRQENERLKLLVADLSLDNLLLKKSRY